MENFSRPVRVLSVEDNAGDIELIRQFLVDGSLAVDITFVTDGEQAIQYLYGTGTYTGAPLPDLILLDLNLPRRTGYEVLSIIKNDERLKVIPVIVLTSSSREEDIAAAYRLQANCYFTKGGDLHSYMEVLGAIAKSWTKIALLPTPAPLPIVPVRRFVTTLQPPKELSASSTSAGVKTSGSSLGAAPGLPG